MVARYARGVHTEAGGGAGGISQACVAQTRQSFDTNRDSIRDSGVLALSIATGSRNR